MSAADAAAYEQRLYEAAKQEGKMVWWYTSPADEAATFIKAFTAKYPGITVDYTDLPLDQHTQKFQLEAQAKKVSADVVAVQGFGALRDAGILGDLSEVMAASGAPDEVAPPDKTGVAFTFSPNGVGYNTNLVSAADAPKSWDDLLNPKWKGQIAVDSRLQAFVQLTDIPAYGGKRQGFWSEQQVVDYLTKLKAQNPQVVNSNTTMVTQVAAGELSFAVGVHLVSFRRVQQKGAPIEWASIGFNPLDTPLTVVPKDAPHPNAGRLFMLWSLSAEGKKVWDDVRGEGDPSPGAGTSQSMYLEQRHIMPLYAGFEYEDEIPRLTKKYREALGIPG
jgi:ABC-type Fe3+ transport system substrate-binding protein